MVPNYFLSQKNTHSLPVLSKPWQFFKGLEIRTGGSFMLLFQMTRNRRFPHSEILKTREINIFQQNQMPALTLVFILATSFSSLYSNACGGF
jgi:hypothetical protein